MSHEYVPEIATDREGNEHIVQGWQDDFYGGKLGFWLFMFTEVMMFGAMFLTLAYYNNIHPQDFIEASAGLNRWLGGTNTVILLISALTMGLGLLKMRSGDVKGAKLMIYATMLLALIFLVIKGVEWHEEYEHGVFLGLPEMQPGNEDSLPLGKMLFYGMYFTMTGLHGFHIIIGIGLMLWLLKRINAEKVTPEHHILHFNIALYWDIVHLIWVFVFPYYYMIGAGVSVATGGHHGH